jgi:hypothetical protein
VYLPTSIGFCFLDINSIYQLTINITEAKKSVNIFCLDRLAGCGIL